MKTNICGNGVFLRERIENSESVKLSIQEKCMTELKTHEVPKYYNFVLTLPYTQNGKYDFRYLEEQGNKFVDMKVK